ncbi:MAG: NYN domain-containing protein [Candidatus Solibacter usitatus]|nr:NYN domain-containing protein [Candidatus Solibacter usitatus]
MARKAALYVDGFNFYYGVRNHFKQDEERRGYSLSGLCWCDFRALVERHFLKDGERLEKIRYFTAPVTPQVETSRIPGERDRYELWLQAARTIPGLEMVFGFHKPHGGGKARDEKLTDVNLAVELLLDGMNGVYDQAYVLSGDTDQIPAVFAAALRLPKPLRVCALLPPAQEVEDWKSRYLHYVHDLMARVEFPHPEPHQIDVGGLTERQLANSLLPYRMGQVSCPPYWRLPAKYLDAKCRPEYRPEREG